MSGKRWRRFLPSPPKIALVFGLLLLGWASVAFLDLAAAKNQALTQHRRMVHKINVAQAQNEMLRRALDGAEAGQNIIPKAYQYFGLTPKDATLIVPETSPDGEDTAVLRRETVDPWARLVDWLAAVPGAAADWLSRILTNLLDRVK